MSLSTYPPASDVPRSGLDTILHDLVKASTENRAEILAAIIFQWRIFALDEQRTALEILRKELPVVLPLGARYRLYLAVMEHRRDLDDTLQADALALSASLHAVNPRSFYGVM